MKAATAPTKQYGDRRANGPELAQVIADADALTIDPAPRLDRVMLTSRRSGACDAVLECARLLRLNGQQSAADLLINALSTIVDKVQS
jgi:hypothetical protein